MDSKEILETFGISKNFGIILFIQSIIVIIGCFLAFQDIYFKVISGSFSLIIIDIINLLLFLVLIYYSFIGFKKNEKHFKIAVYLFIISILISIFVYISMGFASDVCIATVCNIIILILLCYFAYNLNNYNNAKIAILLVILVKIILLTFGSILSGASIEIIIMRSLHLIPAVSIALTYFARYNKEGFKQLDK